MEKRLFSKILGRIGFTGLMLLCMWGCKTKYVAVPEWHTRDSVQIKHVRDSLFFHDSVYVNTYVKGDTVFVDKVKQTYVYKDRVRTDTVAVARRDSVPYAVEKKAAEYKYRERWYDGLCRRFTLAVLIAAAAITVAWLVKKKLKR